MYKLKLNVGDLPLCLEIQMPKLSDKMPAAFLYFDDYKSLLKNEGNMPVQHCRMEHVAGLV
jgi:hypothetical protein